MKTLLGYTLCSMLRDRSELSGTTFIALTGYGQTEDVARAMDAGFHLHLIKPVDIALLRRSVNGPLLQTVNDPSSV